MKSIAIMQPTFMPWIGYFALIDRVDEFVFLDNVQFDKRSWQQRNKIKTSNGDIWLSVPVSTKGKQCQKINEVEILYEAQKNPLDKIKRSIELNYKKAPYFKDFSSSLFEILDSQPRYLCDLNINIIKLCCDLIGLKTNFVYASELDVIGAKEELLVDICKKKSAGIYVSPPGSKAYLEISDVFENAKIKLLYHNYTHPQYTQLYQGFTPFMCIFDLIFNEGPESLLIIQKGLKEL